MLQVGMLVYSVLHQFQFKLLTIKTNLWIFNSSKHFYSAQLLWFNPTVRTI